ncbi:hypothetical protein SDC9_74747 [bioreactor metagenome]|uniref:Uncharacterized protein n=1 Tax=bioreactor metagenome TaxID=1076179 RepID=A0A644YJN7_9ZZZZ
MRRYSTARFKTAGGVCIQTSTCRAMATPATISAMPLQKARSMAVWTARWSSRSRFAPKYRAASTFAPTESPTNKFVSRLIRAALDPTAAMELSPENRPTTITSAALNSSWSTPEAISGTAKRSIFFRIGPLHISIS